MSSTFNFLDIKILLDPKILLDSNIFLDLNPFLAPGQNIIMTSDFDTRTYTTSMQPSCYLNQPDLLTPGILQIISITFNITQTLVFPANVTLLMTYTSLTLGTVCLNGVSQNAVLTDADW